MNSKLLTDIITSPDSNNTITKSDLKKYSCALFQWNLHGTMKDR